MGYIDVDKLIEEKSKELASKWSEYYSGMDGTETTYNACYNAARSMAKWFWHWTFHITDEDNEFKN